MLGKTSTSCQDSISSWCNVYIPLPGSSSQALTGWKVTRTSYTSPGEALLKFVGVAACCSIILPREKRWIIYMVSMAHGESHFPILRIIADHCRSSQIIADHPGVGMPALAATTEATACSRAIQTCCLQKCLQYPLVIQSGNGHPVFWPHFTFIFWFSYEKWRFTVPCLIP